MHGYYLEISHFINFLLLQYFKVIFGDFLEISKTTTVLPQETRRQLFKVAVAKLLNDKSHCDKVSSTA